MTFLFPWFSSLLLGELYSSKGHFFLWQIWGFCITHFDYFFSIASKGATSSLSDIPLTCKLFPNEKNELCHLLSLGETIRPAGLWRCPTEHEILTSAYTADFVGLLSLLHFQIYSFNDRKNRHSLLSNLFFLLSWSLPQSVSFC